ncbi:MAG: hypothetical protein V3U02_12565 [Calditrichia bacterium]
MSNQEFERRQEVNYDLGELPEDITRERSEFRTYLKKPSTPDEAKQDIGYQYEKQRSAKEVGTVPLAGNTIAHYDSRPINALDFNHTSYDTWTVTGGAGDTLVSTTFTIPNGYNAALRGYRYAMVPTVAFAPNQLLLDLQVNGVAPLNYQGLMRGQVIAGFIPTWLLAGPGDTIGMFFTAVVALGGAGALREVHIEMVGNLVLDTGLPLQQEFSNKKFGKGISQVPGRAKTVTRKPIKTGPFRKY